VKFRVKMAIDVDMPDVSDIKAAGIIVESIVAASLPLRGEKHIGAWKMLPLGVRQIERLGEEEAAP
jgi:hypothetical protein